MSLLPSILALVLLSAATLPEDPRERELRNTAVTEHNLAQRMRRVDSAQAMVHYRKAHRAYVRWFAAYGRTERVYDMHYAYAELMWSIKDYRAAYDHYMRVVALDPEGKHSRFCAESAVFAAQEVLEAKGSEIVVFGPDEQRFVDAADQYIEHYPQDATKRQNIAYKAGYLLYQHGRIEEARERLLIAAADPSSEISKKAAEIIVEAEAGEKAR